VTGTLVNIATVYYLPILRDECMNKQKEKSLNTCFVLLVFKELFINLSTNIDALVNTFRDKL